MPPQFAKFLTIMGAISSIGILLVMAWLVLVFRHNLQRLRDIRSRRATLLAPTGDAAPKPRKPSYMFHDIVWLPLCQRVEEAAAKNGYNLVKWERQRVWRSRSTLVLETLIHELESTISEEETARAIGELPPGMDRPDPTGWCGKTEPAA